MARNSSREYLRLENAAFARTIPAGSLVLDAGAGDQPYRDFFGHCRYEAADFEKVDKGYAKSTYVCDLRDIPVEDGRFDAIVFNQVLEHLPEPKDALKELHRVLRPGGRIICTAPLFYEEHEQPYDFYRYTQYGFRYLFEQAGFETLRVDWLEGYFGTVAYQFGAAAAYLPQSPRKIAPGAAGWIAAPLMVGLKIVCRLASGFLYRLDQRSKFQARGFPKNYVVIAAKPG